MYSVIHYSVANMPGAVPRTSTWALTGATLPYTLNFSPKGVVCALHQDSSLLAGLSSYRGEITCKPVAMAANMEYVPAIRLLG
jgi:alanine dehydrogenase